jgi:hypothetical protein
MGTPQSNFKNRNRDYTTSPATPITFGIPIAWVYPVGAGDIVLKDEAGTAVTLANLTGYEGGIAGPWSELTSFTCSQVRMGDASPPPGPPAPAGAASGTTIADAGAFTAETTVEGALQEIYQDLKSAQAQVSLPLGSFVVVSSGAPLVAFNDGVADGFDFIEGVAYRFNVASTAAIGTTVAMPQDLDDTAAVVLHILASRVGASDVTAAITVAAFFQTVGAAYDADTDAGGATGAIAGATTVVHELTRSIAAGDVPPAPCALSITLVPTAALDADDMRIHAVWIEYTRALRTS